MKQASGDWPSCPECGAVLTDEDSKSGPDAPEIGWEYYECPNCEAQSRPENCIDADGRTWPLKTSFQPKISPKVDSELEDRGEGVEDSEYAVRKFIEEYGNHLDWSHQTNIDKATASVETSNKNILDAWLGDAIVRTESVAIPRVAAPDEWYRNYATGVRNHGTVQLCTEMKLEARKYIQAKAATRGNPDKSHSERSSRNLRTDPEASMHEIDVVVTGYDHPKEFRKGKNPWSFIKDLVVGTESSAVLDAYQRAKAGKPVRSAPFVRELGIPCLVLTDYQIGFKKYHNAIIDEYSTPSS